MTDVKRAEVLERVVRGVKIRTDRLDLSELLKDINLGAYCEAQGWKKLDRYGRTIWERDGLEVWEAAACDPEYRLHYFACAGIEDVAKAEDRPYLAVLVDVILASQPQSS